MNIPSEICVSTIARGSDAGEINRVIRAHEALQATIGRIGPGIINIVTFRESNPKYDDGTVKTLESIGIGVRVMSVQETFAKQIVAALTAVEDTSKTVLYSEGDKREYFQNGLEKTIECIRTHPNSDVFIVERPNPILQSFSGGQRMLEQEFNNQLTPYQSGIKDYLYGPKAYRGCVAHLLRGIENHMDINWGVLMYTIARAIKGHYIVTSAPGAVSFPEEQINDSTPEYLNQQFLENKIGFSLGIKS